MSFEPWSFILGALAGAVVALALGTTFVVLVSRGARPPTPPSAPQATDAGLPPALDKCMGAPGCQNPPIMLVTRTVGEEGKPLCGICSGDPRYNGEDA